MHRVGCRQGCHRANSSSPRIQDDTSPRCTGSIVIQRGWHSELDYAACILGPRVSRRSLSILMTFWLLSKQDLYLRLCEFQWRSNSRLFLPNFLRFKLSKLPRAFRPFAQRAHFFSHLAETIARHSQEVYSPTVTRNESEPEIEVKFPASVRLC